MAECSKALVRLVARFRMVLRSWVRVLAKPWTVEPSNLSGRVPWSPYINVRDCLLLYKLGLCYLYTIVRV